jgi:uncharacterized protein (TIGR03663 family)
MPRATLWAVERSRRSLGVLAAIATLSTVAHLWKLGVRPLAHDEAIDAWFSWEARDLGVMRYDPVYHGPLRFYLEGFVLDTFGQSAFWARLVAAIAGIASTILVACSTRTLGRVGAPVAALVFVASPTALTVTRTGREDSLVGLVSIAVLLLVARALTEPRPAHLVGLGVLMATMFTLKETVFLFGLAAAGFFAAAGLLALARPGGGCRGAVERLGRLGSLPWLWALMAFALVFMVVFTSGFRYAAGLESGLTDGVQYWWGQHDVRRGGQPSFFYVVVYAGYEGLALVLAAAGLAVSVRRRSLVGAWFATMFLAQLAIYSWAGEKFAWLALHPLLPAILLGGLGAQAVADRLRAPHHRTVAATLTASALILSAMVAVRPAVTDGADPRELLVTVQTSDDLPPVVDRLRRLQDDGAVETITVDDTGGGSWPWAWYLNELEGVSYQTLDPHELPAESDAMIVMGLTGPPTVPDGYTMEPFRFRVWWVPDYDAMGADDWLRWLVTRETWSPTANLPQYLLLRER